MKSAAGYSEEELAVRVKNEAFLKLMKFQCGRIRSYFNESAQLIPLIEEDARLSVSLMRNVYVALIDRIEKNLFAVLDRQIRLSWWGRSRVIAQTMMRRSVS